MKTLQKAITRFNKKFNMDMYVSFNVYDDFTQMVLTYRNNSESIFYIDGYNVKSAIEHVNHTYNIWLESK